MSTVNIEVKTNFTSVFANISNIEELKEVANIIREQLINAVNTRQTEISNGTKVLNVVAEVTATDTKTKEQKPAPKTKTKTTKTAKATASKPLTNNTAEPQADDDVHIALTDKAAIKKLKFTFEKYNDNCWVLRGDTKPLRKALKEKFKGVFNSYLLGGSGWVFKTCYAQECADALGLKVKVE